MDAVFKDTRQALHVSFLVLSQEPRQPSAMMKAIIQALEALPELTTRQEQWLEQLRGEASSTLNFGGLTSDEVRAQCAAVISAVRTKLHHAEQWEVTARFGQNDFTVDDDGVRRHFFLKERSEAIQALAGWLQPSFPAVSTLAMDCLLAKLFANHAKMEISFRDLAKSFGGNHMTYARAFPVIKARIIEIDENAIQRLRPYFERTGLVEKEEVAEA
ncbi:hypothetical protein QCE62_06990 [Caballeronia sp. LZ033]|uniref:hypothetical protein n=1 Tax=Caballeronia sp. LZ033 TaxID=3038566 RepID=UPI00285A0058|nr:hypothetical protein [Caballeronia sp. LZ033]MDR5813337.1 hypothetical protein [Caballeronia sp. LZ033]